MIEFSTTLAIPTYNRPTLLRRALLSIEKQAHYVNEIIVSDNASPGNEVDMLIKDFVTRIPNLRYIKHEKNIGAEENFFECLRQSKCDLFMWLADDDELSLDCLRELTQMFKTIPDLCTAVPRWHLYTDENSFKIMPGRSYQSSHWLLRAAKFMYRSTDELFYGLHRRDYLLKCSIESFFWPNKHETLNRVYPYLFQLVV